MTTSSTKKPTIGFVGLGIMGLAMARNVHRKGYDVLATNRSKDKRDQAVTAGLKVVETAKDVADAADFIIVMVTDPAAVRNVLKGPNGILQGKIKGKVLVQMSTIDEKSTHEFAEICQKEGLEFIDCPVAGSKKQVEAAELILLAGGDSDLIKKWEPILLSMGKAIVHAGDIGKGTALKLCMNLIVSQMTTAICEASALARIQNVDPAKIFEVINESPAINCGYFNIKKTPILEENYPPAFSLQNMLKDVRFMEDAAKSRKLGLPVTQAVRYLMEAAVTDGHGEDDLTSIMHVLKPFSMRS